MKRKALLFLIAFFGFSILAKSQINIDSLFVFWNDTFPSDTSRLETGMTEIQNIPMNQHAVIGKTSKLNPGW